MKTKVNVFGQLTLAVVLVVVAGCRSTPRGLAIPDEKVSLSVQLVGVAADDVDATSEIQIADCVKPVRGTLARDGARVQASFMAPFKKGSSCSLTMRKPGIDDEFKGYRWVDEPGLLYRADGFVIQGAEDGGLQANAIMQKLFGLEPAPPPATSATISVQAKLSQPVQEGSVMTLALQCSPDIFKDAVPFEAAIKTGTVVYDFTTQVDSGVAKGSVSCSEASLMVDGKLMYRSATGMKSSVEWIGTPVTGKVPTIELSRVPEAVSQGLTIDMTVDQCSGEEVFDVKTKQCVSK